MAVCTQPKCSWYSPCLWHTISYNSSGTCSVPTKQRWQTSFIYLINFLSENSTEMGVIIKKKFKSCIVSQKAYSFTLTTHNSLCPTISTFSTKMVYYAYDRIRLIPIQRRVQLSLRDFYRRHIKNSNKIAHLKNR